MNDLLLAPSILAADFSDLKNEIRKIENNKADMVHIDVMDGNFVPPISFGEPVIESIRPLTKLPFDVHLMIQNPEKHIDDFLKAGADYITFHYEATENPLDIIGKVHKYGKKCGISIKPETPVSCLLEILPIIDIVLIMTVEPGYGGQKLINKCLTKVTELKKIRQKNDFRYIISVDGGLNNSTIPLAIESGVDVIVSGSCFFSGELKWKY